jgi:hypothetical protein
MATPNLIGRPEAAERERVPESLAQSVAALEADLLRRLNAARPRFQRRTDPEIVRVWGRIRDELAEIQLLLARTQTALPGAVTELENLLATRPDSELPWTLAFARGFDHSLRTVVPLFADPAYLRAAIGTRKIKKRFADAFGEKRLAAVEQTLGQDDPNPKEVAQIAFDLRTVFMHRANKRRKSHARLAIRAGTLWRMLIPLLLLVLTTGLLLAVARPTTTWFVLVAVFTAALGSVLSGFFKLRDDLRRLTDLRAFRAALVVQPFVGAAAGLFAFLLVRADVLHVPTADSAPSFTPYGVYGFLAGFSEPFLLGVVRRLTPESDAAETPQGTKKR